MTSLISGFLRHAKERPDAPALWVDEREYSYDEMLYRAWADAWSMGMPALHGIMQFRLDHELPYVRLLAANQHGLAYMPLPESMERARAMAKAVAHAKPTGIAYIMFTSGSTGEPKGVPITHTNALAYVRYMADLLEIGPDSRCSQMHDLTFDFSVHDLWTTWEGGGCLYVVPEAERFAPASFIKRHELTHFACVPSVLASMERLGLLTENAFPSLTHAVFCGEPLPQRSAEAFERAAPGCTFYNIYGPTEATVAITKYQWKPGISATECRNNMVPIGWPFPDHETRINPDGELCLKGPQVFGGYWNDPETTAEKLIDGWYHTGDIVAEGSLGCLHFQGRKDNQVQVRGHRVELGEIESVIRELGYECVCIGWPVRDGSAEGVVAFVVDGLALNVEDECAKRLPTYMVPTRVIGLPHGFPLNSNSKVDRKALAQILETEEAA